MHTGGVQTILRLLGILRNGPTTGIVAVTDAASGVIDCFANTNRVASVYGTEGYWFESSGVCLTYDD
jgi:hypothetical protein